MCRNGVLGTNLGRKVKPVAMTNYYTLDLGMSDRQIGNVRSRFATTQNHDGFAAIKLLTGLELG